MINKFIRQLHTVVFIDKDFHNIVKLFVFFVSLCLKVQKWPLNATKLTFHPIYPSAPENNFWSQMQGMAFFMTLILP